MEILTTRRWPASCGVVPRLLLVTAAFAGASFGQATAPPGVITGTVAYRQPAGLPLDAVIAIRLEDVSAADGHARVVSESIFSAAGRDVPIPFEISYDPADLNPADNYEVRTTITANGALLYNSAKPYRVLTHGAPTRVAITLQPLTPAITPAAPTVTPFGAAPAVPSATALQETIWKLVQVGSQPVLTPPGGKDAQIVFHKEQNRFSASTGCNALTGTYIFTLTTLTFTPSGTSILVCTPEMTRQERAFAIALQATRAYRIQGDKLDLLLGDEVLATFRVWVKK